MRVTLTEARIARAVRAGFAQAGADPAAHAALIGEIVADVVGALHPGAAAGTARLESAA